MQRDLTRMSEIEHDLVVVGAGIHGAAAAWEAARRGLSVALVERGDFGGATSANSLKVLHGGFRYLQSADIGRLRLSRAETLNLLGLAPHLTRPLPCLLPLHGRGKESPLLMGLATSLFNLLSGDSTRGLARSHVLPPARLVPGRDLGLWAAPELLAGAQAGALWYDGLVLDSERLALAFIRSAVKLGALAANYAPARGLELAGHRVAGVWVEDLEAGGRHLLRAKAVLASAGAWTNPLCGIAEPSPRLALAYNLVLARESGPAAVAVRSPSGPEDDPVCGGGRYMFMAPWRGHTLLGTSYRAWDQEPDQARPQAAHLDALLAEFQAACPQLKLSAREVTFFHWGLLPLAQPGRVPAGGGLASRPLIWDHASRGGPQGLFSLRPVKFTTARALAQRAVEMVCRHLGRGQAPSRGLDGFLWGGGPLPAQDEEIMSALSSAKAAHLVEEYGNAAAEVAGLGLDDPELRQPLSPESPYLGCQVAHAVRREMALRLSDLVLRRASLGKAGQPSSEALEAASRIMARELGWDEARRQSEVKQVRAVYAPLAQLHAMESAT